jgi:hypothetical protein
LIQSALYREPVPLNSVLHRHKKLQSLTDYSVTRSMHAVFVTAGEFPLAALDFPLIFVNTGERLADGRAMVSPVAMLGLSTNENLQLDGPRWTARYLPAFIRRYPFLTAGVGGEGAPGVFVDAAWSGFNDEQGEPLFDADGQPTAALTHAIEFLQHFDVEQLRTREFCTRLVALDILKEMQAQATLPQGENVKVEGFLTVDEEKLNALPDATVLELHRNGMLMLLHAHLMSLANLKQLVERKAARQATAVA